MAQEKENFLSRWSRRKQEEKKLPEKTEDKGEAPALPPVENLTTESDFTGFMHPKVGDAVRRVALKKLFNDPHFNIPDPYEPFSGDWTVAEGISEEMLKTLNQARTHLFDDSDKKDKAETPPEEDRAQTETTQTETTQTETGKEDEPRRENT